jgi:hypothetical protein
MIAANMAQRGGFIPSQISRKKLKKAENVFESILWRRMGRAEKALREADAMLLFVEVRTRKIACLTRAHHALGPWSACSNSEFEVGFGKVVMWPVDSCKMASLFT